jgi:FkbM family methyltransferase
MARPTTTALNAILRLRRKAGLVLGNAFYAAGWEVRRRARNPAHSLLGLRRLDIRTIVDVGANTGQFARSYLQFFPRSQILAFEPVPSVYADLSRWAQAEPRVSAFNVALGETEGTHDMYEHTRHSASSSLLPTTDTSIRIWPAQSQQRMVQVRVTTLDGMLRDRALEREVLVKLDVQGYEDRVIRGAQDTFRQAAAAIVEVNLDSLYDGQARFRDIVDGLDVLGLRYAGSLDQVVDSDGHAVYFDALFLRASA